MNSTFAIFLDLLVIGLMVATIVYAVSLNRSIAKLRDGKAELATLLGNLAEAVAHADVAIKGMKMIAGEYDSTLSQRIGTARALIDELNVINETADNLASRIEKAVHGGRSALTPVRTPEPPKALVADRPTRVHKAEPTLVDVKQPPQASAPKAVAPKPAALKDSSIKDKVSAERELADVIDLLRRTA